MSLHLDEEMLCPVKGPPDQPRCWATKGHAGLHCFGPEPEQARTGTVPPKVEALDDGLRAAIAYLNAWVRDNATGDEDVAARLAWYILRKRLEELAHARQ